MTPRWFEVPFGLRARRGARRRSRAAEPVAIDGRRRAPPSRCAARSTAWTRRPTARSTSGTTRPAARWRHKEKRGHPRRPPDPARALRDGARGPPRPRPGIAGAGVALGLLLPGPQGRGPAHADGARPRRDARRPRASPRPASRGDVPARGRQGGLPLLRLRDRLRRARSPPRRARRRSSRSRPCPCCRRSGRSMAKAEPRPRAVPGRRGAPRDPRGPRRLASRRGRRRHGQDDEPRRADDGAHPHGARRPSTGSRRSRSRSRRRPSSRSGSRRASKAAGAGGRGRGEAAAREPRSPASTRPSSERSTRSARASCASGRSRPAWTRASPRWTSPRTPPPGCEAWDRYTERLFTDESPILPRLAALNVRLEDLRQTYETLSDNEDVAPAIGPEQPPPDFAAERAAVAGVPGARRAPTCRPRCRPGAGTSTRRRVRRAARLVALRDTSDAPAFVAGARGALPRAEERRRRPGACALEFETLVPRRPRAGTGALAASTSTRS